MNVSVYPERYGRVLQYLIRTAKMLQRFHFFAIKPVHRMNYPAAEQRAILKNIDRPRGATNCLPFTSLWLAGGFNHSQIPSCRDRSLFIEHFQMKIRY